MSKDINKTDKQGRMQGHWVLQDANGNVYEGRLCGRQAARPLGCA